MSTIYVRAKAGRIARVSPNGEFIPHDRYMPVKLTPYVSRLLNKHGDIEIEPKAPRAPKVEPKAETVEKKDNSE